MSDTIRLNKVRISFPNLVEKSQYQDNEPKYKAHFIIQKGSEADLAINAKIKEVAASAWKDKADKVLKSIVGNNMKYVYQDGELKSYGADTMYLSASSKRKPGLFHANGSKVEATTEAESPVYSGCYVNAIVSIFPTSAQGIAAGISGVQFAADGESFGGGYIATEDDFGAVDGSDPLGA